MATIRALTLGGTTDRAISDAVPLVTDMVGGNKWAADFHDLFWDNPSFCGAKDTVSYAAAFCAEPSSELPIL